MIEPWKVMPVVSRIMASVIRVKKLTGSYPPAIYVSDDEWREVQELELDELKDPGWHLRVCGVEVKHLGEVFDEAA